MFPWEEDQIAIALLQVKQEFDRILTRGNSKSRYL